MKQSELFINGEGDNWFYRNRNSFSSEGDLVLQMISDLQLENAVLEVGCANGWRLEEIRKKFNLECYGVDVSNAAIRDGKNKYPKLSLVECSALEIPFKKLFDLIIVNFVFHWIDRSDLFKSISKIDSLVKDGGYLLIGDFYPDKPTKVDYHHVEGEYYTYKQDYAKIFTDSGLYKEIKTIIFDHNSKKINENIELNNRCKTTLLRKSLNGYYALYKA